MLFIAQNYSYRWWGCHVAGAGDMEERQPALHRLVSLWKLLCLWKVQRYKSLPQSSSRAIFKAWLRIYPYLLKCFLPSIYHTTYSTIPLPQAMFPSFFCQLLLCLPSAHIVQWWFWVEVIRNCQCARHTVLANGDKHVPSVGSEKNKFTAGEVHRETKLEV